MHVSQLSRLSVFKFAMLLLSDASEYTWTTYVIYKIQQLGVGRTEDFSPHATHCNDNHLDNFVFIFLPLYSSNLQLSHHLPSHHLLPTTV